MSAETWLITFYSYFNISIPLYFFLKEMYRGSEKVYTGMNRILIWARIQKICVMTATVIVTQLLQHLCYHQCTRGTMLLGKNIFVVIIKEKLLAHFLYKSNTTQELKQFNLENMQCLLLSQIFLLLALKRRSCFIITAIMGLRN